MTVTIGIIDYGLGNIHSVRKAFVFCGADVVLIPRSASFDGLDGIVLPGVGAFGDGMEKLRKTGLIPDIHVSIRAGRPLLGICLGMQFLFDVSEEMGVHQGLSLIPGKVIAYPRPQKQDRDAYKIPHIGWDTLITPESLKTWGGTILADVRPDDEVYFVHSYIAVPEQKRDVLAFTEYGGVSFAAAVRKGPVWGCQFHPEKSRQTGIGILKNFVSAAGMFHGSPQKDYGRVA